MCSSGADSEDKLALNQDELRGKLEQSEQHMSEVSRKMTKAHKRQENLLAQFEAEIDLLSDKVDQLEDECCEAEQARLAAEAQVATAEGQTRSLEAEIARHERRAAIQPVGTQELADQLEMANAVKDMLVNEMALRTDELACLKVEYAQVLEEKDECALRLRKSEEKSRRLRLHMTKLEVQLAEWGDTRAEEEEEVASAFRASMQGQEGRIRELEMRLAESQAKLAEAQSGKKRWF